MHARRKKDFCWFDLKHVSPYVAGQTSCARHYWSFCRATTNLICFVTISIQRSRLPWSTFYKTHLLRVDLIPLHTFCAKSMLQNIVLEKCFFFALFPSCRAQNRPYFFFTSLTPIVTDTGTRVRKAPTGRCSRRMSRRGMFEENSLKTRGNVC